MKVVYLVVFLQCMLGVMSESLDEAAAGALDGLPSLGGNASPSSAFNSNGDTALSTGTGF